MIRRIFLLGFLLVGAFPATAQIPQVLPDHRKPDDHRLGDLRNLNGYFPFKKVDSPEAWNQRSKRLKQEVKLATGLWPMPTKTPLEAVVHGKVDRDDYTVERVFFQSYPGHYVTGSLYRPKKRTGKCPAVLSPHGHWTNGRFHDHGTAKVKKEIAQGAEKFEIGGRHPLQARCVQLARMGCVVFHYDMVGYADSIQFLNHRPGVRESMNTMEDWGFFSPQAELHLQGTMGLQTYNSIRALDFVLSLPDVDARRIGVTGGSGGGTQTFMLCAVDERPTVSVPAVMVSTAMQGGCTCENSTYLRIDAGNIDLAALAAPRPMALIAANDWTKEMMTKGYPDLKNLYSLLGIEDRLAINAHLEFGHNYNHVNRTFMYEWFNQHFNLGYEKPIRERDYTPLTKEEMTVWTDEHPVPLPENRGEAHERKLLRWMTNDNEQFMATLLQDNPTKRQAAQETIRMAFEIILGKNINDLGDLNNEVIEKTDRGGYIRMTSLLTQDQPREQLPMAFFYPKDHWNKEVVIVLDPDGKAGLFKPDGSPNEEVRQLLDAGVAVVGVDLIEHGEFTEDGKPLPRARMNGDRNSKHAWKKYAGYTFGYNHPLFVQRVQDVLKVIKFVRDSSRGAEKIHLWGKKGVGPIAAAARMVSRTTVDKLAVDTDGFRFKNLNRFDHPDFLPGSVKYGDLPALLALSAPQSLWIAGEDQQTLKLVSASYQSAGAEHVLTINRDQDRSMAALRWLLKK